MRELVGRDERLGTIVRKQEVEGDRRLFRTEQEVDCSERNGTTLFSFKTACLKTQVISLSSSKICTRAVWYRIRIFLGIISPVL